MRILNVIWSTETPYTSIHKVHSRIAGVLGDRVSVENWALQGEGSNTEINVSRAWCFPKWCLKPRGYGKSGLLWVRYKLFHALKNKAVTHVLLDGLGTARVFLPILEKDPALKAVVVFHGLQRTKAGDHALFSRYSRRLELVAVSKDLAEELSSSLGVSVKTIVTAYDPNDFRSNLLPAKAAKNALGFFECHRPILGCVGRLVESKGCMTLLESAVELKKRNKSFVLCFVGEGELDSVLREKIKINNLQTHVILLGHVENMVQLYKAFDLVLIPSIKEGLGLVLQEAVLSEVPVVVSDIVVFREQLADVGPYVQVGNTSMWADTIESIMSSDLGEISRDQRSVLNVDAAWSDFTRGWKEVFNGSN
ncbi:glycosyltransferase [Cycloclasticus pugetii]|uniref:glycosyltransferase n=1 Tax=Cycloclasticus pugetii TaxID=34068 RepID=UPI003A95070E